MHRKLSKAALGLMLTSTLDRAGSVDQLDKDNPLASQVGASRRQSRATLSPCLHLLRPSNRFPHARPPLLLLLLVYPPAALCQRGLCPGETAPVRASPLSSRSTAAQCLSFSLLFSFSLFSLHLSSVRISRNKTGRHRLALVTGQVYLRICVRTLLATRLFGGKQ